MSRIRHILFFLSLLLTFQPVFAQPFSSVIDSIIHLITPETYQAHFDSLHTQPGSFRKVTENDTQSPDHDACRDYILRTMQQYLGDENVYMHSFDQENYWGLANVIGIKPGTNPAKGILIISAHYDSSNSREDNQTGCSPGANDNGTGLASILEIARILSKIDTECSLLFAAWDFEEQYTYGYPTGSNRWYNDYTFRLKNSKRKNKNWENKIAREKIIANINFDMFGNPGDTIDDKPVLWACSGNFVHKKFVDEYVATFNRYIPSIKAINKGEMDYSDHFTFAARKIPSVENLESKYQDDPFYHTSSDNLDNPGNIDIGFATQVTHGGLAFLLGKAGLASKRRICPVRIPVPFFLIELNNTYRIEDCPDESIVTIHDQQGNNVSYYRDGDFYSFYPKETGLYQIAVYNSTTFSSMNYLLQKKEGQPVPF